MNHKYLVISVIAIAVALMVTSQQQMIAFRAEDGSRERVLQKSPIAIVGDNIYVIWWTNQTANGDGEVMFRSSNDSGGTFGDKINLSNNTVTNSIDAEIAAAEDGKVIVTWWERNSTSNEPVMKISIDNGTTFGSALELSANGTIGTE